MHVSVSYVNMYICIHVLRNGYVLIKVFFSEGRKEGSFLAVKCIEINIRIICTFYIDFCLKHMVHEVGNVHYTCTFIYHSTCLMR